MMRQRVRWARGVIQSLQNTHAIFSTKLPFSARITYLNSFLYWWSFFNRLIFILAPIMFALFDFQVVNCTLKELLIFWLPSYFFYSQSMRMLSSNIRSQKWSQIIDTTFAPSLVIPVLLETLHIRETKFKVTNKKKTTNNSRAVGYMIPHLVLVVLSVLAIIRFVHGKYGIALIYSAVIIYWLCHNLISLLYALAFMLGRDMPRKSERIAAQEKAVLRWDGGEMLCRTDNVSDAMVVLYYAGILLLYLFSMPADEALVLAGFDRYACSIIVLFAGGVVLQLEEQVEDSLQYTPDGTVKYAEFQEKTLYQRCVMLGLALLFGILTSEYNGTLYTQRQETNDLTRIMQDVVGDRWPADGKEDATRYLFYGSDYDGRMTSYYFQYVARYYLYAPNVDAVCS